MNEAAKKVTKQDLFDNPEFKQSMANAFNSLMNLNAEERAVAVELLNEWVQIMNNFNEEEGK